MRFEDQSETARRIAELAPWFHNMTIDGIETAPDHFLGDYPRFKFEGFRHALPDDLLGASVLDVGCNAGFYSIEMARRGAGRVVGIDSDPRYLAQAAFAAGRAGVPLELRQMDVYDVAALGEKFDLVIFMGVLYHLRHPLLALDLLWEHVVGDTMLFQCMQRGAENLSAPIAADYDFNDPEPFARDDWPRLWFIENRFSSDPTNWFVPNQPGMETMLRSSGFAIEERLEREVYLCRRGRRGEMVPPPPRIVPGE